MSKLVYRLKPEFKGKTIRRQVEKMGEVTLDTSNVKPSEYEMYVTMGFKDVFEVEETERAYALVEEPETPKGEEGGTDETDEDEEDLNLNLEEDEPEAPEEPRGEESKEKATPKAKRTAKK